MTSDMTLRLRDRKPVFILEAACREDEFALRELWYRAAKLKVTCDFEDGAWGKRKLVIPAAAI